MELDSQTLRSVWWKGAIGSAIKGIPQGLMLGLLGAGLLFGGIYALGALAPALAGSLAADFGAFLYAGTPAVATSLAAGAVPAFSLASMNVLPIVALNMVLTAVGNFLTGGKIACNAYKQDIEHRMNEVRISQIEAREQAPAPSVAPSRTVQAIVAQGPRQQTSHAAAEEVRASAPSSAAIH